MDPLEGLNRFANAVAAAMNAAQIPDRGDVIQAVMIVFHDKASSEPPIGASLNYDQATHTWYVAPQVSVSEPMGDPS